MKVLITGATGFIGQALCSEAKTAGYQVVAAVRQKSMFFSENIQQVVVGDLVDKIDWKIALQGVDMVVHLAGRAHVFNEISVDPISLFREVNVNGTINIARQAVEARVKRFVFISSIGVNGNTSSSPFLEIHEPNSQEPYAVSKYEAENVLNVIAKDGTMDIVIIRPPLVYGSGAPGNFGRLLKWVNKGVPLPFGAVDNQRSFIALENLVNFILFCMDYTKTPQAANQVFLISDGEDVSTTELLQKVAKALGKKPLLIPVPVKFMMFVARMFGKQNVADKLFGSLQIDSSKAKQLLSWEPVITMDDQLKKTADAYLNEEII